MIAYSIIVPVYNEEDNLALLQDELLSVLANLRGSYEVIYVDDGSTDGSFEVLERLYAASQNRTFEKSLSKRGMEDCPHSSRGMGDCPHVKVIKFRTNYGKSAALAAGFRWARGDIIITLDADLQDDPHEIPKLIEKLNKGYDMVCGWRYNRRDPLVKRLSSKAFNMAIRILTGIKLHDINCGLKVFKREVTAALHIYGELHRLVPVLAFWNGFEVTEVEVYHRQRKFNKSKFGIERFPGAFFDLLAARFKTRYAYKPLHLFGVVGLLLGFAGLIASAGSIVFWFRGSDIRNYYLLVVVAALLIMTGTQFLLVGILGEMIASAAQKEDGQYLIHKTLE